MSFSFSIFSQAAVKLTPYHLVYLAEYSSTHIYLFFSFFLLLFVSVSFFFFLSKYSSPFLFLFSLFLFLFFFFFSLSFLFLHSFYPYSVWFIIFPPFSIVQLMSPSAGDAFDAWGTSTAPAKITNVQQPQQHRYAEFEFTEDPFKDVGFADPFASTSEDPFSAPSTNGIRKKVSDNLDPFAMEKDPFAPFSAPSNAKIDFDSSFGCDSAWNSRIDPFNGSTTSKTSASIWGDDLQFSGSRNNGAPNFNLKARSSSTTSSSSRTSAKLSEEDQIAWASSESVRLERERLRKAELQEKADLEMAIALSKSEVEHRMITEDRLIWYNEIWLCLLECRIRTSLMAILWQINPLSHYSFC